MWGRGEVVDICYNSAVVVLRSLLEYKQQGARLEEVGSRLYYPVKEAGHTPRCEVLRYSVHVRGMVIGAANLGNISVLVWVGAVPWGTILVVNRNGGVAVG